MKQRNPPISRAHRAISIARAVFLITIVAGVACFAARGVYTSRASKNIGVTTAASGASTSVEPAPPSAAANVVGTITVNTTSDVIDGGDGLCTLREAIIAANSDAAIGVTPGECDAGSGDDTLTITVSGTINLSGPLPSIDTNMAINGPGSSLVTIRRDTGGEYRVLLVANLTVVSISGVTITNGKVASGNGAGAGINNGGDLILTDVVVSGNQTSDGFAGAPDAGPGGGISNGNGSLTMVNSVVSGNLTGNGVAGGQGGYGGGIQSSAPLTLINSVVIGNTTGNGDATGQAGAGGGIFSSASVTMVNSVISGNSTGSVVGADGGGVWLTGSLTMTNCTITGNSASSGVGHGVFNSAATTSVSNTIIAQNGAGGTGPDVAGAYVSHGHNLIGNASGSSGFTDGSNGDQVGTGAAPINPLLGPLGNNGGQTQSHALLPGSPAIDAGDDARVTNPPFNPPPFTDQRGTGFDRNADGNGDGVATVDIGAYEVQSILVTNTNDSGAGSLRQAITDANATTATDAITFQAGLTGTIDLLTVLPDLSTSMSINGPGANLMTVQRSTAGGTPNFRIFRIMSGNTVSISGLTISNGRDNINESFGGAIFNELSTLTVNACTISGNSAVHGGGIYNNLGTLNVTNSTFSGNSSTTGSGGGIFNDLTLNVTNSTFSGNSSTSSGGGAILNSDGGTITVTNSTLTNNSAGEGGGIFSLTRPVSLRNSIVALNTSSFTCGGGCPNGSPDLSGNNFTSLGHNIVGSTAGATITAQTGDKFDAAASPLNLGPLASNGGPTQTHALLASSVALDAGDNCVFDNSCSPTLAFALTTDQRGAGFSRKADSADTDTTQTVDIGAFEAQASVEDITNKFTTEDTPLSPFSFNVGDAGAITDVTASSSNTTLVPNLPANLSVTGSGSTRTLNITPAANQSGTSTITVTVTSGSESMVDTFVLTVTAATDEPSVTPATTNEDVQTSSGLVITRNADDGPEITHFKITGITNGTLFKNNGTTQINNDGFITSAEGNAGLKFTPTANLFSPTTAFSFNVQAATDASGSGLSSATTATITVNPVADVPSVTPATTTVNTLTTSGLVISRNAVDGNEVSHFKITNITNGTLFKNDGATQITNNTFITFAEGNAGLRFKPGQNLVSPSSTFSFHVQGATSSGGAGLGSAATATITVNCGSTVVTSANDSGAGSLRSIINGACPGSTITFAAGLTSGGPATIVLASELVIDKNLTITGPGANLLSVSGNNASRVFNVQPATVYIIALAIIDGYVSNAVGGAGGGVINRGALTLINCAITDNTAGVSGGGLTNFADNAPATLTIINSTISGNEASSFGGGLNNAGNAGATVNLINSTVAANGTPTFGPSFGGGIYNSGNAGTATLNIKNSTIAGNYAGSQGGGIYNFGNNGVGILNLANTLVSDNTAPPTDGPDIQNHFGTVSGNNNLIETTDGYTIGGSNNIHVDPMLEKDGLGNLVLKNNGGPTKTLLLKVGSPAINAGSNALLPADTFDLDGDSNTAEPLPVDQRGPGFSRVVNTTVDIGALEANYTITATAGTPQSAVFNTTFTTALQATVKESGNNQSGIPVTFTPPASGPSGTFSGSATVNTNASGVATAPAFTANSTVGGPYNVVARLTGGSPSANFSLTNLKANQTITFNALANKTFGNADFNVSATASSGLAVSFTASGQCTVTGTLVHITGAGSCTITAKQAGNANYNPAPDVPRAFTIAKANQTITFNALANKTFGNADFNVSATATSGLAVSFTASGQCTVTGTLVHLTGAGSCTVTAKQAGNTDYHPAPEVPRLFTIAKAVTTTAVLSSVNPSEFGQSVTFTATVTSGAGTPTGTVQFKDGAANIGLPQTLTAGTAQVTTSSMTAGLHTITANYSGDANFVVSTGTLSGGQTVKSQPTLSIGDISIAEGNSGTTNLVFTVNLSAASNLTVNVDYSTSNGTATTSDSDYQSAPNTTITFNPGNSSQTVTVLINGDQKFEPDETLFVNLANPVNAAISDTQGIGTILNDDSLQLVLDASGPDANQLLALESVLFVRDPFRVRRIAEWLNLGADQNTRLIVFAANLQLNPGETAADVEINLIDGNGLSHDVTAEQVAPLPDSPFTQIIFRLPDNLSAGTCLVTIRAHGQTSNAGTIRIVQ